MYSLLRYTFLHKLLAEQLLSGGAAFIIANQFYVFHSFALECLAFLATWAGLDFCVQKLARLFGLRKNR
ncbi:MAG: hypothetical protein HY785_28485 [Oscillatoriophycideae cyanobacterium NC_groundwater_1537_Pr4_S-0.65um_50_18]|nr:hypothetical protein [Oscillatoriophycideae cyanobacterium NC_groundwater_1537_Pr4_S-0.65um_50_18]